MFKKKPAQTSTAQKKSSTETGADNTPFFILGCVRSGTTMLRDILKDHPRLECPEETHFFRWADPYGSPRYERHYLTQIFKDHRKLDQIPNKKFHVMKEFARNRKEISDSYGRAYLDAMNNPRGRWFDKTPQNIYGITMINYYYPTAKFVHIYRNPLNVVASLCGGKVMAKHSVVGGINYWNETMIIIEDFKKHYGDRLLEIEYEAMVAKPKPYIEQILEFVGEDPAIMDYKNVNTHKEKNKYKQLLNSREIALVQELSEPFYTSYGYKPVK